MLSTEEFVTEDLKAFERRLTEIISGSALSAVRWKFAFLTSFLCVAIGAYYWIIDLAGAQDPFVVSILVMSYIILLVMLYLWGYDLEEAPSVLVRRVREVLTDFCMDCDETGKLILMPQPVLPSTVHVHIVSK